MTVPLSFVSLTAPLRAFDGVALVQKSLNFSEIFVIRDLGFCHIWENAWERFLFGEPTLLQLDIVAGSVVHNSFHYSLIMETYLNLEWNYCFGVLLRVNIII